VDFRLAGEQRALRDAARRFARGELGELARELEGTNQPVPVAVRRRYGELGFLGVNVPEAYGGMGLGHVEALLVLEQFAQVSPAVAFPVFESATGPVRTILHFAGEPLRRRLVPQVVRGDIVVAVSMSEPNAGTALTDLTTRGRIADGEIVITGQKRWCSGGGHADAYVVYCRLSDAPGAAGIGAVLVEKDRRGVSFGRPELLMGFRGIPSSDIFLDDVRVPLENLIVPAGGFKQLMEAFDLERCGNATMSLGIATAALEEALAYVQERRQFGRPIVDFQAVQLKLADMATGITAARLLTYRAAETEAAGSLDPVLTAMARLQATSVAMQATLESMRIHGGYGYVSEFPVERFYRDAARLLFVPADDETLRAELARRLAGGP
jgi:alkylation response protein AidB-like acyl-CoA dehydrogenase